MSTTTTSELTPPATASEAAQFPITVLLVDDQAIIGEGVRQMLAKEKDIAIMCPNLTCRKVLAVPASARGTTVRCRNCTTSIRIPGLPVAPAPKPVPGTPPAEPNTA